MSLASQKTIVLHVCTSALITAWTFSVGHAQPPAAAPAPKPAAAPAPLPVAPPPAAGATKFKEDAVDPDVEKAEKELISKRKQAFLKPETWATVGTEIKGYYQRVYLPRMTQIASLNHLATLRMEFMREVDKSTGPMRVDLLDVAFKWAGMVAMGVDYHPAVRINATFVLAELEEVRLVSSGTNTAPPVPYEKSLQALAFIVSSPTKVNDGMRAVAIYGLSRYIRLSQNQANREIAVAKLMGVLTETCPASRDGSAHAFMKGMALDGLMHYDKARSDANMAKQLIKIASDHAQPSFLRVKAAEIIGGKMSKPKDVNPPVSELDENFKQLIAIVFEHEAVRLESLKKKPVVAAVGVGGESGAMGGDYAMSQEYNSRGSSDMDMSMGIGMGMGMGMAAKPAAVPQPPDIIMSRRRVNWLLEGLHLGWDGRRIGEPVTGAKTGIASWDVKDPDLEAVANAVKLISTLQTTMNDLTISKPEDYAVKLRQEAARLIPGKEGTAVEAAAPQPAPSLPDPAFPGVIPGDTEIPAANPLEAGAPSGAG